MSAASSRTCWWQPRWGRSTPPLSRRDHRPSRRPRELRRVWRNLQREDIFPVSMSALIGGFCGRRDHLVPNRGLRQLVRRHIEFEQLADAVIPLHLVAFDLIEGREVLLSEGPAVETIVAAASIPGVFPPVQIADRRLIDGGVVNNTPISHAVELGADRIFVLPTRDLGRIFEGPPATALDTAIYGLGVLDDGRLQSDIARYSARGRPHRPPESEQHRGATDRLRSLRPSGRASAHRRPSPARAAQGRKAPATRLIATGRCCS